MTMPLEAFKALENIEPNSKGSVVKEPLHGEYGFGADVVLSVASMADEIPAWGLMPAMRDRMLRSFWPTESNLASAIYTTVSRYAGFGWQLDGPSRMVSIYEKLLHSAEFGEGWQQFISKLLLDLFTQDNGAFIEIVRERDSPTSPVVSINHLDANQCIRTGVRHEPVIFYDRYGVPHLMKWYQCVPLAEFPSPIEVMRGMQYCAVTRMLRAAQIMRDVAIYKHEKISGRFVKALWLVGGIQTKTIEDAMTKHGVAADNSGLARYIQPVVIGSLDPTAKVSAEKIELASLPDGFDEDKFMRWYINQIALAFGSDYQEYAPLPGGGLGSGAQAETLHLKSRGKGPRLFMSMLEHIFNWQGILPTNVAFTYGDQDVAEDMERTRLRLLRAEERATRIKSGELTPEVARQIAVDVGDLDEGYLDMLAETDLQQVSGVDEMGNPIPIAVPKNPKPAGDTTANATSPDNQGPPTATSSQRTRGRVNNRPTSSRPARSAGSASTSGSGSTRVRASVGTEGRGGHK